MKNYRLCTVLLVLFAAGPVLAHDQLPTIDACRSGKPRILGSFGYVQKGLRDYQICLKREAANLPGRTGGGGGGGGGSGGPYCLVNTTVITMVRCPAQTCGDFDDDYSVARALALSACTSYVGPGTEFPEGGLVVPVFEAPQTFFSENHHADYQITQGISGTCVLCPDEVTQ